MIHRCAAAFAVATSYAGHSREQDIDVIGGVTFVENLGAPLDAVGFSWSEQGCNYSAAHLAYTFDQSSVIPFGESYL